MNKVVLAVAGSRKTQSIVDACAKAPEGRRILTITFTLAGQLELESRLRAACPAGEVPEVMGWYSFLLRHWIRPFLPLVYPGRRLRGLNFDGKPPNGWYTKGEQRHLDGDGRAYKLYLSKLATEASKASKGMAISRLQRIYDEIYIDEVQDLTGCDLYMLEEIMQSRIDLTMVGDIRQSVLETNSQDPNLKQYRGLKKLDWFAKHEKSGLLDVEKSVQTWRSNQQIAAFSDTIFPATLNFPATESMANEATTHDGVFVLEPDHVTAYVERYDPLCLRESRRTAANVDLPFRNFGVVKGITTERVLIYPTKPIAKFLKSGDPLAPKTSCGFYVAVTRARHSVAFVLDDASSYQLPAWSPR
ncbi:AAA domain-containing protein [Kribbella voronezhensis]|uniref:AAA domain-containing protein n=1 Tax=Kribbella voronezhensis TaxID=2512212 RepID=A0A4R7T7G1_9ACTN|nr:UvrD-helicase domain-containing protein [Kribbella voronezhensis]TDU87559.1 AAA domain-containing protein [Kribbella voronezhensis]